MKKLHRPAHPSETSRRSGKDCRQDGAKEGSWSFTLTGNILFALGATEQARRAVVRTPTGELRFLPR